MAVWLESEVQPSSPLEARSYGLGSVNESGVSLASPEGLPEHSDYFDFGHNQTQPKRSPTYPFVPPGPNKAHILDSLGKASTVYHPHQKRKVVRPIPNRNVHNDPSLTGVHRIRHSSTVDTKNSDSFEHTAIWDQKAILSLGMYSSNLGVFAHQFDLGLKPVSICFHSSAAISSKMSCLGRMDKALSRSVSLNLRLKQPDACFWYLPCTWSQLYPTIPLICRYAKVSQSWMTLTNMQMEEVSADTRHF